MGASSSRPPPPHPAPSSSSSSSSNISKSRSNAASSSSSGRSDQVTLSLASDRDVLALLPVHPQTITLAAALSRVPTKLSSATVQMLCSSILTLFENNAVKRPLILPSHLLLTRSGDNADITLVPIVQATVPSNREEATGILSSLQDFEFYPPEWDESNLATGNDAGKSSVYVLALIFYWIITGIKPFDGWVPAAAHTLASYENFRPPLEPVQQSSFDLTQVLSAMWVKPVSERLDVLQVRDYLSTVRLVPERKSTLRKLINSEAVNVKMLSHRLRTPTHESNVWKEKLPGDVVSEEEEEEPLDEDVSLQVHLPDESTIHVELPVSAHISDLMEVIETQYSIPQLFMKLVCLGKRLHPTQPVSHPDLLSSVITVFDGSDTTTAAATGPTTTGTSITAAASSPSPSRSPSSSLLPSFSQSESFPPPPSPPSVLSAPSSEAFNEFDSELQFDLTAGKKQEQQQQVSTPHALYVKLKHAAQHLLRQDSDVQQQAGEYQVLGANMKEINEHLLRQKEPLASYVTFTETSTASPTASTSSSTEPPLNYEQQVNALWKRIQSLQSKSLVCMDPTEITVDQCIGRGNFGYVMRGILPDQTQVAVKFLSLVSAAEDASSATTSFDGVYEEIAIMCELQHENLLRLLGACLSPLCLITELMKCSLYDYLHNNINASKMDDRTRLLFALDIANGMKYLHTRNIVHRDLKTSNVLVSPQARLKISDFGLSRNRSVAKQVVTALDVSVVAPEVLRNPFNYDDSSDVYSFGLLLWELLTREEPYAGLPTHEITIHVLIRDERPAIPGSCSPEYGRLIRRCWTKEPEQRPNFAAICDQLIGLVRGS